MSVSPYKRLKIANRTWVSYINISQLTPHHGYKILGIIATHHDKFGPGQMAHIVSSKDVKYKTQLPGKCLREIGDAGIEVFKSDAARGHNPYLVFREVLVDKSYRLDIVEKSADYDELFIKDEPFPELENSVDSVADDDLNDQQGEHQDDANGGDLNGPEEEA